MAEKQSKLWASITAFITGLGILLFYLKNKMLPLTEVYLDGDRRFHATATSILALFAFLFFTAARKKSRKKSTRVTFYILAVIFLLGFPLLVFFAESSSFRGFEYALETLGIGFLPAVFVLFGALILYGWRILSMILLLFFSILSLIHLVSLFQMIGRIGKAFNTVNTTHVLVTACLALVFGFFAYLNFRHMKKSN